MLTYGICILPLIRELCITHPHVTQPCYANDARVGGNFVIIREHIQDMMVCGPPWGYFQDPTKRMLVVSTRNIQRAEEYFRGIKVRMFTRSRYLGEFIGDPVLEKEWLDEKVKRVGVLVGSVGWGGAPTSPDSICWSENSLQQECAFVQRVTSGIREVFSQLKRPCKTASSRNFSWVPLTRSQCGE